MKNTIIALLCFIISSSLNAQEKYKIDSHNIKWYLDYDTAKETSMKEKKLTLLYFTGSDWCGACKLLEDNYFSKKQFKKLSKNFVLCEVDIIKKAFNKKYAEENMKTLKWKFDLLKKFNANSYPTLIVLDKNENVLCRVSGYHGDKTSKKITNLLSAIIDINIINGRAVN